MITHRMPGHLHSEIYQRYYLKLLRALLVTMSIILLLMIGIIYTFFAKPTTRYYASTTNGEIYPMESMQ